MDARDDDGGFCGRNGSTLRRVCPEQADARAECRRGAPSQGVADCTPSKAVTGPPWCEQRLTPRSSGAPTAGHQARSGGTRYIFASPGLASCRRRPLSSNVRRRTDRFTKLYRFGKYGCTRPHALRTTGGWYPFGVKVSEILRLLQRDGWFLAETQGSHRQFKHGSKRGRVTVPGKPSDDLAPGTLNSILKQASLK